MTTGAESDYLDLKTAKGEHTWGLEITHLSPCQLLQSLYVVDDMCSITPPSWIKTNSYPATGYVHPNATLNVSSPKQHTLFLLSVIRTSWGMNGTHTGMYSRNLISATSSRACCVNASTCSFVQPRRCVNGQIAWESSNSATFSKLTWPMLRRVGSDGVFQGFVSDDS